MLYWGYIRVALGYWKKQLKPEPWAMCGDEGSGEGLQGLGSALQVVSDVRMALEGLSLRH